jgi:hypothetical protein
MSEMARPSSQKRARGAAAEERCDTGAADATRLSLKAHAAASDEGPSQERTSAADVLAAMAAPTSSPHASEPVIEAYPDAQSAEQAPWTKAPRVEVNKLVPPKDIGIQFFRGPPFFLNTPFPPNNERNKEPVAPNAAGKAASAGAVITVDSAPLPGDITFAKHLAKYEEIINRMKTELARKGAAIKELNEKVKTAAAAAANTGEVAVLRAQLEEQRAVNRNLVHRLNETTAQLQLAFKNLEASHDAYSKLSASIE